MKKKTFQKLYSPQEFKSFFLPLRIPDAMTKKSHVLLEFTNYLRKRDLKICQNRKVKTSILETLWNPVCQIYPSPFQDLALDWLELRKQKSDQQQSVRVRLPGVLSSRQKKNLNGNPKFASFYIYTFIKPKLTKIKTKRKSQ